MKPWILTGCAGFIGSHLLEALLRRGVHVVGIDDFSTGTRENLEAVRTGVKDPAWRRFRLLEGDITDPALLRQAVRGGEVVLHQAALCSVQASVADPARAERINVGGTVQLLDAARQAGIRRVVIASSSAVYGDNADPAKVESRTGRSLSPYAASKAAAEKFAEAFAHACPMEIFALRYFNVYGPRQDPNGPYAAVIPRWLEALRQGVRPILYGDGRQTRDFCHVAEVVQANLLAATVQPKRPGRSPRNEGDAGWFEAVNIGTGKAITLLQLFEQLKHSLPEGKGRGITLERRPPRPGDIRHSRADVRKARRLLGFAAQIRINPAAAATPKPRPAGRIRSRSALRS